jgi:hypothetical protein
MTLSPKNEIPGYDFVHQGIAESPVSSEELQQLEQTLDWTADDERVLRKHATQFEAKSEKMVDSWRAAIAAQPYLSQWFVGAEGKPDEEYKARVRRRFVQWVVDAVTRPHDRHWLNYQEEIGLRHTPAKKNRTDGSNTPPLVPLRYLLAFIPVVIDIRRFFECEITESQELEAVLRAWSKTVYLHVLLWVRPYTTNGLW